MQTSMEHLRFDCFFNEQRQEVHVNLQNQKFDI